MMIKTGILCMMLWISMDNNPPPMLFKVCGDVFFCQSSEAGWMRIPSLRGMRFAANDKAISNLLINKEISSPRPLRRIPHSPFSDKLENWNSASCCFPWIPACAGMTNSRLCPNPAHPVFQGGIKEAWNLYSWGNNPPCISTGEIGEDNSEKSEGFNWFLPLGITIGTGIGVYMIYTVRGR